MGLNRSDEDGSVLAERRAVKRHHFAPSGRVIWTVVGREGDQLLLPDQPYCSCRHYHYRVLRGLAETCRHLEAYRVAVERGLVDEVTFDDGEYYPFLLALIRDLHRPRAKR